MVNFPLVNDDLALAWMVQMHCIDMNAWYSRVDKPERPDFVLFDLDPPDGGFGDAVRVAHLIRGLLEEVELPGYVKTSGADGIHVVAPITRRSSYSDTYDFAERASRLLERRHDGLVTTEWLKKKRRGVLVDHRQNGHGKTIASVYSVRPRPGAPVSTPLAWEELTEDLDPRAHGMSQALERVERHGDLFAPVLEEPRPLAPAARALAELDAD
jgi:bifunctional non-homologous end joining protein LigD